jgi:hypothetical protein
LADVDSGELVLASKIRKLAHPCAYYVLLLPERQYIKVNIEAIRTKKSG